jgi:hypothetical protein
MTAENKQSEHDHTPYFGGGEWAERVESSQSCQEILLALGSHKIEAGGTKVIPFKSNVPFQPDRLVIPPNMGKGLLLFQIRYGNHLAILDRKEAMLGGCPSLAADEKGRTIWFKIDEDSPLTTTFTEPEEGDVTIINVTDEEQLFAGGLFGTVKKVNKVKSVRTLFEKAKDWYARGFSRALEEANMRREGLRQFEELPDDDRVEIGIFGAIRELAVQAIRFARLPLDAAFTLLDEIETPISRDQIMGFGWTLVKGNSSANINVQPQVSFRPERLVIPSTVAKDFLITYIKVGKNSQLLSVAAVPALAFAEQAPHGVPLQFPVCRRSQFITISVTNISDCDRWFTAAMFGPQTSEELEDLVR